MKTILLLLLVLATATGPARALQCHVCTSSTNCKQAHTCPPSARFCRTMLTVEPLSGNLVKKDCVDSCEARYFQQGQVSSGSAITQCCQGDLCNTSLNGATTLSRTTVGLALALGLLTVFLAPRL
ncbi:PREDICTED: lymphocyte antigen 6D [Chrysochloris asiatica]|uniref:Lymphocyte antigen 6D n=1 Tax=Chrysochloris asiatica TaxID=185453 RepID=A0A9B0ST93_CHRAS|nr:PREDICTED: lymphocyte antigen 6D [Chrysochloris asiatica]